MALSQSTQFGMATAFFGLLSFLFGILGELKKPPHGTPIRGRDVVVCKFPSDPTVALGALSAVAAACCAGVGAVAIFFPYKGKPVPRKVLFDYTLLYVFFHLAIGITVAGISTTAWVTASEATRHVRNVHGDFGYECPTATTGVLGGAAFLNLDASLFWLLCLMLAGNVREDYFDGGAVGDEVAGLEEK
uniref:CASP-like protein n=1 Tax=Leersia perrieri TaxID=77586 RepID=A0A0D9WHG7_9ORYZ